MSTFQTLMALVVLIFVLSVIVQAVQEVLKSALKVKASTLADTVQKFMGNRLTLPQVQEALAKRGLELTALEHYNKDDFRQLLDGIPGLEPQLHDVIASATATFEEKKDNVAASFDAARASFQKAYTKKNKVFAIAVSTIAVLALNANVIMIYQEIAVDQVVSQAIIGKATAGQCKTSNNTSSPSDQASDFGKTYSDARDCIKAKINDYPVLLRSSSKQYAADWDESPTHTILGLLVMGLLVSLGAPFWNDVLKGMTGVNNALNSAPKKDS
jgi:hypothetical protein